MEATGKQNPGIKIGTEVEAIIVCGAPRTTLSRGNKVFFSVYKYRCCVVRTAYIYKMWRETYTKVAKFEHGMQIKTHRTSSRTGLTHSLQFQPTIWMVLRSFRWRTGGEDTTRGNTSLVQSLLSLFAHFCVTLCRLLCGIRADVNFSRFRNALATYMGFPVTRLT